MKATFKHKAGTALLLAGLALALTVAAISGCTVTGADINTTTNTADLAKYDFYSLFIGINKYPGGTSDLNYCVADAVSTKAAMSQGAIWNGKSALLTLTDSQAKFSEIKRFILLYKERAVEAAKLGKNDVKFIMTFSGHGSNDGSHACIVVWNDAGDEFGYIWDFDFESWFSHDPVSTGLPESPSIGIVYLDSCYSGGIIGKSPEEGAAAKVYTGTRGYDPNFSRGWQFSQQKGLENVGRLIAVTATSGEEVGWESPSLGHGVFSYYLCEGLGWGSALGPADINNDGFITVQETYEYLSPRTVQYSTDNFSSVQTPQIQDNYGSPLIIK